MAKVKLAGIALAGLVVMLGLFWGLQAAGIITLDIQREVIQHSQQYTETKTALLAKLHKDWTQLESEIAELESKEGYGEIIEAKEAQQKSIVNEMEYQVTLLTESELPDYIRSFLRSR